MSVITCAIKTSNTYLWLINKLFVLVFLPVYICTVKEVYSEASYRKRNVEQCGKLIHSGFTQEKNTHNHHDKASQS